MGSYESLFEITEEQSGRELNVSNSDWITGHADLTGLAVVEVQRYWNRFKQLGCDKKGYLDATIIEESDEYDLFVKNIITGLPRDKKNRISFIVFLNFLHWLEESTIEMKLKVIFGFLNNGNDLDEAIFKKLLKKIYKKNSEDKLEENVELIMSQLDPKNTGKVTEAQFVKMIKKNYKSNEIQECLNFTLIPEDILRNDD